MTVLLDSLVADMAAISSAAAMPAQRAAGYRAMMRYNAVLMAGGGFPPMHSSGIASAGRCLRGEGFDVFSKYDVD